MAAYLVGAGFHKNLCRCQASCALLSTVVMETYVVAKHPMHSGVQFSSEHFPLYLCIFLCMIHCCHGNCSHCFETLCIVFSEYRIFLSLVIIYFSDCSVLYPYPVYNGCILTCLPSLNILQNWICFRMWYYVNYLLNDIWWRHVSQSPIANQEQRQKILFFEFG